MKGNDIIDVSFLGTTLPYFDLTTVDRSMRSRIADVEQRCQINSVVVGKIEELPQCIEKLVSAK